MTGCLSQCLTFGDHASTLNPKVLDRPESEPQGNLLHGPHSNNQMTVNNPVSVRNNAILDTSIGNGNGRGELGVLRKTKGTERIVRSQTISRPRLSHNAVTGVSPAEIIGNLVLFNAASRFVCRHYGMDS